MGLDWSDGPKTTAGGYEPTKTRAILLDVEVLGDILASNGDPTTTRQSVSLTVTTSSCLPCPATPSRVGRNRRSGRAGRPS